MTYPNVLFVYSSYIIFCLVVFANSSDKQIPPTTIPDTFEDEFLKFVWPKIQWRPGHKIQSPVDIQTENATFIPLPEFQHVNYWGVESLYVNITNNGHTVHVELTDGEKEFLVLGITGGPLFDNFYEFDQMHIHWANDTHGSEHTLDGKSYAMEIHFVHFNSKYNNAEEAMNYIDGYCVLSYFGELSEEDDPEMENFISDLQLLIEPYSSIIRKIGEEFQFLEKTAYLQEYFTYPGSLTTTPFSECVIWMAFINTFKISKRQLAAFRQLRSSENHALINGNDRDLQPFNNRPIKCNFIKDEL
ncbi:carbonic anhydrase 2-like [Adelges cooleyi]|uniref:carbonic anhydrase 2-like n=1 Tax=Adelges cooleyi TaxID=133065 RepID=UPI00217F76C8|nr:carbonic anhydrase 2-like [Adelges cooleyi]